jgi:hypothetical protein
MGFCVDERKRLFPLPAHARTDNFFFNHPSPSSLLPCETNEQHGEDEPRRGSGAGWSWAGHADGPRCRLAGLEEGTTARGRARHDGQRMRRREWEKEREREGLGKGAEWGYWPRSAGRAAQGHAGHGATTSGERAPELLGQRKRRAVHRKGNTPGNRYPSLL